MSTVPGACGGVLAVIPVLVTLLTVAATPSSATVAPNANPVPETCISDGKLVNPLAGEIAATVGAARGATGTAGRVGADGDLPHPRCMAKATAMTTHTKMRLDMGVLLIR